MGYAICRIEKITSAREMDSRYKHNYREYDVANADGHLSHLNREVKSLNGKNYIEASDDEMIRMRLNGYNGRKERSDAIRGIEVVLSYSYEDKDTVPLDKWIEKNVAWLEENFNPKEHKIQIHTADGNVRDVESDNVKSIVVHMDEAVPHIHAFIVPIDEKGALNAKRYTFNRQMMQGYQTSYSKAMEEFGLKRGAQNQKTTFDDIKKYHNELKNVVSSELPEILPGESVQEYRVRANEEFQREKIHHRNDVLKLKQEVKEARSERITQQIERNKDNDSLGKQIKKLSKEMNISEIDAVAARQIRREVKQLNDFKEAVKNHPDKDKANQLYDDFMEMIRWQREQEKKKKKKEREEKKNEKKLTDQLRLDDE